MAFAQLAQKHGLLVVLARASAHRPFPHRLLRRTEMICRSLVAWR
ncbi:MAG: hypothetical protein R2864_06150 [Syntrophotaleaceae bacterium]